MSILDHISESLETIFWVQILELFDADPGIFLTGILDEERKKIGSQINIRIRNYVILFSFLLRSCPTVIRL